jgi:hypothetical protein
MNAELRFEPSEDARAWFVQRLREQAASEALVLPDFDQRYLQVTASGDDKAASAMLDTLSHDEFDLFDQRISGLMWRRYQADISLEPERRDPYQRAIAALAAVDTGPNLGMFVNCVALEMSPDEIHPRGGSRWMLIAFLLLAAFLV